MSDDLTRRRFLKYGMATASAIVASVVVASVDKTTGFQVGRSKVNIGMAQANATCGFGAGCAGGGGECGFGAGCAGGGGVCGFGAGCAGGGGVCGFGAGCAGS
jgi:hypothetical protein